MTHVVINRFYDKEDEGKRIYNVGDIYPFGDVEVTKERLEKLSSKNNAIGKPLIKLVEAKVDKDPDEKNEKDDGKENAGSDTELDKAPEVEGKGEKDDSKKGKQAKK